MEVGKQCLNQVSATPEHKVLQSRQNFVGEALK